jgi:FixJ family two-component response regulator
LQDNADMLSQPARVAIVDDDASVLRALSRLLGTCSYRTATYRSAREFLDSLQHGMPECLVVDMQMPEFTGLDLLHHLMRHGIQIPSIVITGHDEAGVRERCEAVGTRAYLLKPLRGDALIAAIDAATGRERAEEDASIAGDRD